MARRSPTDPAEPASSPGLAGGGGGGEEKPSPRADLQIILMPPDRGYVVIRRQGLSGVIAWNLRFPVRVRRRQHRRNRR